MHAGQDLTCELKLAAGPAEMEHSSEYNNMEVFGDLGVLITEM